MGYSFASTISTREGAFSRLEFSVLDFLLMEDPRYLGHPFLSFAAEKFTLRREGSWIVKRSGHDISESILCSFSILQYPASTGPAKFTVQQGATAVISFMNNRFLAILGVGK